jgi:hypothetical protein
LFTTPSPRKKGRTVHITTEQLGFLDFTHFPVLLKQFNEFHVQERRKWEEEYGRNSDGVALAL